MSIHDAGLSTASSAINDRSIRTFPPLNRLFPPTATTKSAPRTQLPPDLPVLFTGQYEHTIDAKNRLAIPSDIRSRWSEKLHGTCWYATPVKPGLIRLYTEKAYEERASATPKTFTPDEDESDLQVSFFAFSERLEIDSAGRVRFPDGLLESVSLTPEVILVGAGDRLEVRDRATWHAERAERLKNLPNLMKKVAEKNKNNA